MVNFTQRTRFIYWTITTMGFIEIAFFIALDLTIPHNLFIIRIAHKFSTELVDWMSHRRAHVACRKIVSPEVFF